MNEPIHETHLEGLKLLSRGKVRDIYDLGASLLIVATDRISAFDVVMPTPIRDKGGRVLWKRMKRLIQRYLPPTRICHPYPLRRMGVLT